MSQRGESTEPFHRFGRLTTEDPDEAQNVVERVYVPHKLEPVQGARIQARLNAISTGSITFGYLSYGATSRVHLPPMESVYHVNVTLLGSSYIQREDGQVQRTAGLRTGAILRPDMVHMIEWAGDAGQIALKIPKTRLEQQFTDLTGQEVDNEIDIDVLLDLTTPPGRSLLRAIDFVQDEWENDGALVHNSASRRQLESLVLTNLLLAGTGEYRGQLEREHGTIESRTVRLVVDFIEDFAIELPTLDDLTRISRVSARSLQIAFRRELGCTPSEYVRRVRLNRARAELLTPQPGTTTVSDVASTWGFYNPGRFAMLYRNQFGEQPSQTLARALGT
jgi:AraC-like DNA-binding protein